MIILIEGADCSGKTTLAECFMCKANVTYFHNGPNDNSPTHYVQQLSTALELVAKGNRVVIDRAWISEQVYGNIFRGECTDPSGECAKVFHRLVTATVMCVRGDTHRHLQHFNQMATQRHEHAIGKAREIIRAYHELWYGSVTSQLPGFLKTISEKFPLNRIRGYYQYDMDVDDPETFAENMLK